MHQYRTQRVTRSVSLTGYSLGLVLLERALRGDHEGVKLLKPHERILLVSARRIVDCPLSLHYSVVVS